MTWNNRFIYAMCICIAFFNTIFAQQNGNTKAGPAQESAKPRFSLFYEKVYLQCDRQFYVSGEDIWFKAYLLNAQSNFLTNTSNNLYVELITPESKILERSVIRLDNGIGNGDFKLKDSIPEGKYRIRAYTKWMLNFGDKFIFEKEIQIHSKKGVFPKIAEQIINPNQTNVRFLPEGGSLLAGVGGKVAFKATDASGKSCDIKGSVISSQGDTACWFESMYQGMGEFTFLPILGQKYYAAGIANQKPFKIDLPTVTDKGFSMRIVNNENDTTIQIYVSTNQQTIEDSTIRKELILQGSSFGKTLYGVKFMMNKMQTAVRVPKSTFPNGIARFTLYDSQKRPNSERTVYIENKNKIVSITLTTDKKEYKPREAVRLKIKTANSLQQPVKANLSLAVTDAGLLPAATGNIVSYTMLESEVKGKIENPSAYFDQNNPNRYKELDMLLLTQGWRSFLWRQIADTLASLKVKYLMEPGISISGKLRKVFFDKPLPHTSISLVISGSKKNGMQSAQTDSLGKFYFDEISFFGTKKLHLKSIVVKNGGADGTGLILMDSLFMSPIPIVPQAIFKFPQPEFDHFNAEANNRLNVLKKYSLTDTVLLNEIVIKTKNKKDEEQLNTAAAEGGIIDRDFKISQDDLSYFDIAAFLIAKLPKAQYLDPSQLAQGESSRIGFRSFGKVVRPRFVLNGFQIGVMGDTSAEEQVYNLSMDQIERITISESDIASGNIERTVINVFTKPGATDKKDLSAINQDINGYYEARVFYAPDYNVIPVDQIKPDLRTTIYWNPNLITNEQGEAEITFFNADSKTEVRALLEGISEKGAPLTTTSTYNIK
jgi:hypothetical protein